MNDSEEFSSIWIIAMQGDEDSFVGTSTPPAISRCILAPEGENYKREETKYF